jgi:hypothetical protein
MENYKIQLYSHKDNYWKKVISVDYENRNYVFLLNQIVNVDSINRQTWPSGYKQSWISISLKNKKTITIFKEQKHVYPNEEIDETDLVSIREKIIELWLADFNKH